MARGIPLEGSLAFGVGTVVGRSTGPGVPYGASRLLAAPRSEVLWFPSGSGSVDATLYTNALCERVLS